jgi:hypothetical protein
MLFLAAEFPFQSIEGVEFAVELHTKALENIARCRRVRRKCDRIRSINIDAADYSFPLRKPRHLSIQSVWTSGAEEGYVQPERDS